MSIDFNLWCPCTLGCVYHPLEHGQSTMSHTLKENWLSPRSYQLPMGFRLGIRVHAGTFSAWTLACFMHSIVIAVISRWSYTVDPENTVVWLFFVVFVFFFLVTYHFQILYSFNALPQLSWALWEEGLMYMFHLGMNIL